MKQKQSNNELTNLLSIQSNLAKTELPQEATGNPLLLAAMLAQKQFQLLKDPKNSEKVANSQSGILRNNESVVYNNNKENLSAKNETDQVSSKNKKNESLYSMQNVYVRRQQEKYALDSANGKSKHHIL